MVASRGATLNYNPGVVATGGSAPWDVSTLNWLNGGVPGIWPNTTADTAIFGGTGINVSVQGGGINAGNLTFNSDAYIINGGALTFAGPASSTITVGTGFTTTFNGTLLGGFTKAGAGVMLLSSGSNVNTGNVTAGAGTLRYATSNQIADAATLTVNSGAVVDLNGFNDTLLLSSASAGTITNLNGTTASTLTLGNTGTALNYTGVFAGNLAVADTAASAGLTLSGTVANTNTGLLTLNAPVQNFLNKTGVNAVGGSIQLAGGGLVLQQADQIADTGRVNINLTNVTSTLRFDLNNFNDTIGSLASTNSNATNPAVNLGTATLTVGKDNGATTFAGIIAGTGSIVKVGTGNWSITGANTFTGGLTVNAGTITINADAALGVNGTTYAPLTLSGAVLSVSANVALNAGRVVYIGTASTFNLGSTLTLPVSLTVLPGTEATPGTVSKTGFGPLVSQSTGGSALGTGSITLTQGLLSFAPSGTGADVALTGALGQTTSKFSYNIGTALALTKGDRNLRDAHPGQRVRRRQLGGRPQRCRHPGAPTHRDREPGCD